MWNKIKLFFTDPENKISRVSIPSDDSDYTQELRLVCRKCKKPIGYMINVNGKYFQTHNETISRVAFINEVDEFLCDECFAKTDVRGDS